MSPPRDPPLGMVALSPSRACIFSDGRELDALLRTAPLTYRLSEKLCARERANGLDEEKALEARKARWNTFLKTFARDQTVGVLGDPSFHVCLALKRVPRDPSNGFTMEWRVEDVASANLPFGKGAVLGLVDLLCLFGEDRLFGKSRVLGVQPSELKEALLALKSSGGGGVHRRVPSDSSSLGSSYVVPPQPLSRPSVEVSGSSRRTPQRPPMHSHVLSLPNRLVFDGGFVVELEDAVPTDVDRSASQTISSPKSPGGKKEKGHSDTESDRERPPFSSKGGCSVSSHVWKSLCRFQRPDGSFPWSCLRDCFGASSMAKTKEQRNFLGDAALCSIFATAVAVHVGGESAQAAEEEDDDDGWRGESSRPVDEGALHRRYVEWEEAKRRGKEFVDHSTARKGGSRVAGGIVALESSRESLVEYLKNGASSEEWMEYAKRWAAGLESGRKDDNGTASSSTRSPKKSGGRSRRRSRNGED